VDFHLAIEAIRPYPGPVFPSAKVRYVIGGFIYGGKTNELHDRMLVNVMLARLFCPPADSVETTMFAFPPVADLRGIEQFLETMSSDDSPGFFGLHRNARARDEQRRVIAISHQFGQFMFQTHLSGTVLHERHVPLIKELHGKMPEMDGIGSNDKQPKVDPMTIVLENEAAWDRELITEVQSDLSAMSRGLHEPVLFTDAARESAFSLHQGSVSLK
jgi:hypothetical protein